MNDELLLLEDLTIPSLTFGEFRDINEGFHNLLPSDLSKKKAHAQEVFDMIQKSYADQGGIKGKEFKTPETMIELPMWKLSKKDGKINALTMYKDASGRKSVAIATDGSPEGKNAAGEIVFNDLKRQRAHMEISGKALSSIKKLIPLVDHLHSFESAQKFHKTRGDEITRPQEDDPEVVRHPEFKNNFYTRNINGHTHTKLMIGCMGKTITEAMTYNKDIERESGKTSEFGNEPFRKGAWTFKPQIHAPSQAKEHRPEFTSEYWHQLHDKVHAVLQDKTKQLTQAGQYPQAVKTGECLFYSGKQQQGYFANVDNNTKELRVVTVLAKGKSRVTKPTDQRIILDHVVKELQTIFLD